MKTIQIRGKCSHFGGPDDGGVGVDEGLALLGTMDARRPRWAWLFGPEDVRHPNGLARRLRPETHYCAMRWPDHGLTYNQARRAIVRVLSETGALVYCTPVDYGPAAWTERVIDLSPGAAAALGVQTDDVVGVEVLW